MTNVITHCWWDMNISLKYACWKQYSVHTMVHKKFFKVCNQYVLCNRVSSNRDSRIAASCIICPLKLKGSHELLTICVLGCILNFPMNKSISDVTHFQCSGTHKDHGSWIPGINKEVNSFEPLIKWMELWLKSISPSWTNAAIWNCYVLPKSADGMFMISWEMQ